MAEETKWCSLVSYSQDSAETRRPDPPYLHTYFFCNFFGKTFWFDAPMVLHLIPWMAATSYAFVVFLNHLQIHSDKYVSPPPWRVKEDRIPVAACCSIQYEQRGGKVWLQHLGTMMKGGAQFFVGMTVLLHQNLSYYRAGLKATGQLLRNPNGMVNPNDIKDLTVL